MNKKYYVKTLASLFWSISLIILLNIISISCKEEPRLWDVNSTDQVASEYIASKPEFSEFAKLVEVTGMGPLLGIRGPYTIMLPNNDAMFSFYKVKGVNSLMDFDEKFRNNLLRNHIITNEIPTGDMGLGALRDTNAIGDFLVTEFQGADIILNKYSKIIDRDVRLANGYAHVIDQVIYPVTKDIYTVVAEDPSYKIFAEGLRITGLNDTLQLISFPYGNKTARTRFTIFAVPDTIYQSKGIQNVGDLIKWTGAYPDSITYLNNPFYRYMEYHCLNGTHYLSDLNTQLYPILSQDNNISLTVDNDYKINLIPKTQKYTAFIVPASNTPAKNGAIHAINGLLPVIEPDPSTIIFETTDFFDLKQKDCYGKYYQKWSDGKNTFAKIKWVGDFLQYYIKPSPNKNNDALNMLGWWELSVTFPKVMKGNYKISIYQPEGWFLSNCEVYLDGVKTEYTYRGPNGGGPGGLQQVADGYFKTTTEHTLTLRNLDYGGCWWDYIKFVPME
jgi:uncharacterized surface protein with fasciclin (FAS1) repeats